MDRNLQQSLTAWALIRCCDAFAEFKGLYSEDQYFHIALSQLLPTVQGASDTLISESSRTRSSRRILSLYLIYALYAPHPISLNPFHTILSSTARALSSSHPSQADGILGDMMLLRYLEVILADQGSTLDGLIPVLLLLHLPNKGTPPHHRQKCWMMKGCLACSKNARLVFFPFPNKDLVLYCCPEFSILRHNTGRNWPRIDSKAIKSKPATLRSSHQTNF
ncbi:uncharacterized protein EI90DRAFT_913692 [Cantharellus anzutake]|uniref:uncharacterized protein n=1 Tax=Cantharellus anzutake TaxID=1750568 RepID=UPI001906C5AC|nr:uncharacterized protein EI90DRAFT_913692 [Cantharellus anzutake]KAF8332020.1 hypothetical protein EI90DRAFT_913692 [Cantharellus anzutake]